MEESPVEAAEGEAAAVENAEDATQVATAVEGGAPAPSPAEASAAPPPEPAPQLSSEPDTVYQSCMQPWATEIG